MLYVGWMDGMGLMDGKGFMVSIGNRYSKSTFGANKSKFGAHAIG